MNTNSNDDRNETDFLFRSPYNPEQQAQAIESCLHSINRDLEYIKTYGFEEFSKRCSKETLDDDESVGEKEEENLGTAFEGTLRDYQIFMLERAKVENTIVHLGTGMGKTLISIMLMKEFLSRRIDGKKEHILFLVPSIALAVQHTDSLRANLPCRVETACHTSSNTAAAREDIANADVVVATHGTAMDLLTHYPDVLSLDKVR
jgi:ERCC4-related helicase